MTEAFWAVIDCRLEGGPFHKQVLRVRASKGRHVVVTRWTPAMLRENRIDAGHMYRSKAAWNGENRLILEHMGTIDDQRRI